MYVHINTNKRKSIKSNAAASVASTAAAVCFFIATSITAGAGLNDTGQSSCYDLSNAPQTCSAAVGGDAGDNPRQDARFGRDAQVAALPPLVKIGDGSIGFDYSKIATDGRSFVDAKATPGDNAADWGCTKDNTTGLIWEVKTSSGLRSMSHTYTWYSTDSATNGGYSGDLGADTCNSSLAAYNNQCNTRNYVAAVNAASLCGVNGWRLPTRKELLTLVHAGASASPHIDTANFPNTSTITPWTWTRSTHAQQPAFAWYVNFFDGNSYGASKIDNDYAIRLVR